MAQPASLRAEVGACLGSGVLSRASGTAVGEGEHPWHHFGSWVEGVEGLVAGGAGLERAEVACYSVKTGRLRWVEEALGL